MSNIIEKIDDRDEKEFVGTSSEFSEIANTASLNLLPTKSRKQYEITYNRFREWCFDKKVVNFTENVRLAYFYKRLHDIKPSSLWSEYSIMKACLSSKDNINIKNYKTLMAFIKQNSVGFRAKKSKVFNREHIYKFLKEAPDSQYLMKKVAAIFGITCRRDELQKLSVDDIEEVGSILIVKVPRSETDNERSFVIRGTTVRGAFDPINEIADICKKHNIWLHIDAAWGGGLIFSQKHRAKLNGIERANSLVVNPHKLLAVPQQCSLLLVQNTEILYNCFSRGAEYLFQKDKHYDRSYDLGDKYLQCGRKCDVFKFWFMWKAKGSSGFANHIDTLMDLAEYFEEQVNTRPEFQLVSKRQYMNVCFWYLPRYLRAKTNILENSSQLHKVAPQIRALMIQYGSVMLGYQPLKGLPNFFRFVSQNSALTKKDVDFILDHIKEIGDAIFK
ncbi:unnamed protein product [Psylliodes chrysocephalus]|uniref:Glutamate decarboxylase n=1 Tax=Psylliodes chrysocephalus TaxID=3402493 RepID=A0A9P0CV90_9CUCU|nr:unnamed protein product [Psylliodes chrysocephala]